MRREPDAARRDLLVEVAKLYWEQDLSQQEIARKLGVARSSVSGLLKLCRDVGIVEIRVNDDSSHAAQCRRELCSRFDLADAVIVPSAPDPVQARGHVGMAAAAWIQPLFRDGVRIGISWGTTLYELVRSVTPAHLEGAEVVQLHGGLGAGDPDIDGFGLAQRLAEKLHGSYRIVQAPMIVRNAGLKKLLLAEKGIAAALERGAGVQIALFGIGSNNPGISSLVRAGYLQKKESRELLEAGAVGTVCGFQIGDDGRVLPIDVNRCLVGIDHDTLLRIPVRVGAAAGREKADAVLAALRGRFVTVLVVDEETADAILRARP
jgi:deoxyribonucleoside regulator